MQSGLAAGTGLSGNEMVKTDAIRHFSARLGREAIRIGQAHGYALEDILHIDPEVLARAGEGDAEATKAVDAQRLAEAGKRAGGQRTSKIGRASCRERVCQYV